MARARLAAYAALMVVLLLGAARLAAADPAPCRCGPRRRSAGRRRTGLVVAEVVTGGASASDEYVELANAGAGARGPGRPRGRLRHELGRDRDPEGGVDGIAAWSSPGAASCSRTRWACTRRRPTRPTRAAWPRPGGSIVLRPAGGTPVDAVGWGDALNAFVEGRLRLRRRPAGRSSAARDRTPTTTRPTSRSTRRRWRRAWRGIRRPTPVAHADAHADARAHADAHARRRPRRRPRRPRRRPRRHPTARRPAPTPTPDADPEPDAHARPRRPTPRPRRPRRPRRRPRRPTPTPSPTPTPTPTPTPDARPPTPDAHADPDARRPTPTPRRPPTRAHAHRQPLAPTRRARDSDRRGARPAGRRGRRGRGDPDHRPRRPGERAHRVRAGRDGRDRRLPRRGARPGRPGRHPRAPRRHAGLAIRPADAPRRRRSTSSCWAPTRCRRPSPSSPARRASPSRACG